MQRALVTGANSGIGRATAIALAEAGYEVFGAMRSLEKGAKLIEGVRERGGTLHPIELDVSSAASVTRAAEVVAAQGGPLDVLVNNAGIAHNACVEDVDIDAAKEVFETNYWGVIRCVQAFLPGMRERRQGQIVNISSVAGRIAALGQVVYSSSKWALECLSENLAQEVAPFGVRVVVIEPGVTRTAILPKNFGHPEPTVYGDAYRRMLHFYARGIKADVQASEVAAVLLAALEDPECGFRYTCAWSGPELCEGRSKLDDATWIALGDQPDDAAYHRAFEAAFGLDIRPPENG
ncbi:MAG: SDR family oxidoreductase [Myxococcota bacterium]|jgi:NAD(P)-dependent dehydrogenase (short-subunit alcohol dehydrogenase family)